MKTRNLTKYVDPFIGSGSTGHTFPGATRPFGMLKLGPDCGDRSSNSGYLEEGSIQGFSHTHVSGAGGGPAYGNILVMPCVGELNLTDFASKRSDELAALFFSVFLTEPGVARNRPQPTVSASTGTPSPHRGCLHSVRRIQLSGQGIWVWRSAATRRLGSRYPVTECHSGAAARWKGAGAKLDHIRSISTQKPICLRLAWARGNR